MAKTIALIAYAVAKTGLFPTSLDLESTEIELPGGILTEQVVLDLANKLFGPDLKNFYTIISKNEKRGMAKAQGKIYWHELKVKVLLTKEVEETANVAAS